MTLTLADYAAIAGMMVAIIGLPLGVLGWQMRNMSAAIETHDKRIREIETRHDERFREIEAEKVDKKDWIRESMSVRTKIDAMTSKLAAIDAKIDASYGVGAAINRLAERMERRETTK